MRNDLLGTASAVALMVAVPFVGAQAGQAQVSAIYGSYDAECGSNIDCSFGYSGYNFVSSGGNQYDSPSLFIVNQTNSDFIAPSLTLTGYQADNNGLTATINLPTIASHTIYDLLWGSMGVASGSQALFNYDYDDEYGQTTTNSLCVQPYALCSFVGNFDVKFTATLNGAPIASNFSPDNTQGGGNQAGTFVGWEGLNASGLSETVYDDHSGSTPGVLAYIYNGTTGNQNKVPEPATLALLGAGLGALGLVRRRRRA